MTKGERFGAGRARYGLLLGMSLGLLGGCSTEILFDLPAEREKKLAAFYQCLQPESRGTCPEAALFSTVETTKPGGAGLKNPFRPADPAAKNAALMGGAELSSARRLDFAQFVRDLEDPVLANGYALALSRSPQLDSFLGTVRPPPAPAGAAALFSAEVSANQARAAKIQAFREALAGPGVALAAGGDQTRREDIAASVVAVGAVRSDAVKNQSADEAEGFRARLFAHEGQTEIDRLATLIEKSPSPQVEVSVQGGTMRNYYELARQVEQRNGWESYKLSADVNQAYTLYSTGTLDPKVEDEARYAAFFKAYIGQYFRRGQFIRGYFFEEEFNKLRADYKDVTEKLLRLEAMPAELVREFEEEIAQAVAQAKGKVRDDLIPREIAAIVLAWRDEAKINRALEDKYGELAGRVKEEGRKFGARRAPALSAAERDAFVNDIEIMLQPYAGELRGIILRQLKRFCFVNAGDRPVIDVIDTCLKSDLAKHRDAFGKEYSSVKEEIQRLARTYGDYMRKITVRIDEYLDTLKSKIIVRKDVGSEKFVARNESSYQVPALEYRISSKGLEYLKLEGDSYIPVIRDFIRVVVEAYFDARHGLPGASTSTGVSDRLPEAFRLPDIGKVAREGGYKEFRLEDFALVDEKAARIEALTSLGVATLVRGAGPLSIGNEAIEAVIETVVSVAARKASEKAFWCVHACGLSPEQAEAKKAQSGTDLAARLMSVRAPDSRPQSRRVRITVTHNPVGFLF